MRLPTMFLATTLVLLAPLAGCSAPASGPASSLETVHIPQSPGVNQGGTSFCWSYAIMAYLESENLLRPAPLPGLKLANEYVGFYHILNQLKEVVASESTASIALDNLSERNNFQQAFAELAAVGVVPDFEFAHDGLDMVKNAKAYFAPKLADTTQMQAYQTDPETLRLALATAIGVPPPPRPDEVVSDLGATPLAYLETHFALNPGDFVKMPASSDGKMLEAIRRSLLAGHAVVAAINGHAILIVDFITAGGHGGVLSGAELEAAATGPIVRFVVKNSIGPFYTDQNGDYADSSDATHYDALDVGDIIQAYLPKSYATSH
jgi:hypothetical protein